MFKWYRDWREGRKLVVGGTYVFKLGSPFGDPT